MKQSVVATAILMIFGISTPAAAQNRQAPDSSPKELRTQRQERIQALSRRGKLDEYQQLLGMVKLRPSAPAPGQRLASALTQSDLREAAFNLAALGFTAADVKAYREFNIDLLGAADNLNKAKSTAGDKLLLADTVIVAIAGKSEQGRNRLDGFLSAIPLSVVKSLKGTRAPQDTVYLPQASGRVPDGSVIELTSEIRLTPGKTYLLALSKNWYEQRAAEERKQTEPGFNAMLYIAQEVTDKGALLSTPSAPRTGAPLQSINAVEKALKKLSVRKAK